MITEDQLQQLCFQWCQHTVWSYAYGPDIASEGDSSPNLRGTKLLSDESSVSDAESRIARTT